jgi:hypothetical protein
LKHLLDWEQDLQTYIGLFERFHQNDLKVIGQSYSLISTPGNIVLSHFPDCNISMECKAISGEIKHDGTPLQASRRALTEPRIWLLRDLENEALDELEKYANDFIPLLPAQEQSTFMRGTLSIALTLRKVSATQTRTLLPNRSCSAAPPLMN